MAREDDLHVLRLGASDEGGTRESEVGRDGHDVAAGIGGLGHGNHHDAVPVGIGSIVLR